MEEKPAALVSAERAIGYRDTCPEGEPQGTGMELRVSVRRLVEFLLRHGDIDNRHHGRPESATQEGGRIHRMIQRRMGTDYQAEVSLHYRYQAAHCDLIVEGRADGIIESRESGAAGEVIIDEIKGTFRDVSRMKDPILVHVAQAKCYAAIYGQQQKLKEIRIRMTYCNMETEEIRYFYQDYTVRELEIWFLDLLKKYQKWADYEWEWKRLTQQSIHSLEFPFPYRKGQKELASFVYRTIYHKKKLFLEAPTGVGKTLSVLYPSLKAMGKGLGEKIFYLTAKTITRTVAEKTYDQLREGGLRFKSIIITAKEKICFMEETECNPEACPYAQGHYDRINDAVYELLIHEACFTREKITEYAQKHQVCPYEMSLDVSLFADGIICDYNYLFDPHVYLRRFFGEGAGGNYLFLVDEAHNLLERGREMYSAALIKEDFLALKKDVERAQEEAKEDKQSLLIRLGYDKKLKRQLEKCNKEMLALKRQCEEYRLVADIDPLVQGLLRLHSTMDDYLDEVEEVKLPVREDILNFYFLVCHFLEIYERVDENYVKYTMLQEDGSFLLKLFCVNPAENLRECMGKGRSTILFSATLLPIQYYKRLLGGENGDFEVYAESVFNQEKRALLIANDVTSKYTRRTENEYQNIARYIYEIVKNRHGNYMVFCPSYTFMKEIHGRFEREFGSVEIDCIYQKEYMDEQEREDFLHRFEGNEGCDLAEAIRMEVEMEEDKSLVGFCVLGGIFSEGIDLKNDRLIGAIIIGTGLPQIGREREILKDYFDRKGESGFDYAYRYPGMNKVLQAAGRVIRTAQDIGIIALLDERFLQYAYQRMFPREWSEFEIVDGAAVAKRVERFWDSWL